MTAQPASIADVESATKAELAHVDSVDGQTSAERSKLEKDLIWKQDLRIVPLSAGIFLLCYLDRSNIGEFTNLWQVRHIDKCRKCKDTQCR